MIVLKIFLPVLVALLIFLSALGFGLRAISFLQIRTQTRFESLVFGNLVGLGVLGTGILILGLARLFQPVFLWGFLLVGLVLGLKPLIASAREIKFCELVFTQELFCKVIGLCALMAIAISFLRLLVPPTSSDELSYHLYLPKLFLLKGSVIYSPYHVNSVFPLLTEMLYSYGVTLDNEFIAKSVHWGFGLLTALGSWILARNILSETQSSCVAALLLTVPVVNHQMGLANNDLALSAFLTGSYAALFRWVATKASGWLILSAILSGFAMEVKYLALFGVAIQTGLVLAEGLSSKQDVAKTLRATALFATCVLIVSVLPYARSLWYTGNPFYPYLTTWFGGRSLENPLQLEGKGFGKNWLSLFLVPWNATFHPQAFGGLGNQWGPIFLAFLPGLFFLRGRGKLWSYLWLAALFNFATWFYTKQNLRFLLPVLPFASVFVIVVLDQLGRSGRGVRWAANASFIGFLILHLGVASFQLREDYRVAMGFETRESYLRRKEPSFDVAQFLNRTTGKQAKILSLEHRAYYFDGEVVRERAYRRWTRFDTEFRGREQAFYERLRKEGFTHILLVQSQQTETVDFWKTMIDETRRPTEAPPRKIYETRFSGRTPAETRTYLLYAL